MGRKQGGTQEATCEGHGVHGRPGQPCAWDSMYSGYMEGLAYFVFVLGGNDPLCMNNVHCMAFVRVAFSVMAYCLGQ